MHNRRYGANSEQIKKKKVIFQFLRAVSVSFTLAVMGDVFKHHSRRSMCIHTEKHDAVSQRHHKRHAKT